MVAAGVNVSNMGHLLSASSERAHGGTTLAGVSSDYRD
jgi:hypothetical protein